MVANLDDNAHEEAEEDDLSAGDASGSEKEKAIDAEAGQDIELPDGTGMAVLCAGRRGEFDDAAAAMLRRSC
ncbi:hypothetical protein AB6802_04565 [Mesorhizobium sp. RCC_202]|uniref:hypothetical protein n=1 Tax=Mesorhizobium sp. RCC_202 TaxID=3239222 RepID=UPI003526751B